MGFATLNAGSLAVWIDPKLPDPFERALSGLRRPVGILAADSGFHLVRAACDLLEASDAGRGVTEWSHITAGPAARGIDEPPPCAFLGSNWLRTLEAVLP